MSTVETLCAALDKMNADRTAWHQEMIAELDAAIAGQQVHLAATNLINKIKTDHPQGASE